MMIMMKTIVMMMIALHCRTMQFALGGRLQQALALDTSGLTLEDLLCAMDSSLAW